MLVNMLLTQRIDKYSITKRLPDMTNIMLTFFSNFGEKQNLMNSNYSLNVP